MPPTENCDGDGERAGDQAAAARTQQTKQGGPKQVELLFNGKGPEMQGCPVAGNHCVIAIEEEAGFEIGPRGEPVAHNKPDDQQRPKIGPRDRHEAEKTAYIEFLEIDRSCGEIGRYQESGEHKKNFDPVQSSWHSTRYVLAGEMIKDDHNNGNTAPTVECGYTLQCAECTSDVRFRAIA